MTKLKLTSKDRAELAEWNDLVVSIKESSDINPMDTTADIQARRRHLEKDPESWFRYYLRCTAPRRRRSFIKRLHTVFSPTRDGMRYARGRASWQNRHGP